MPFALLDGLEPRGQQLGTAKAEANPQRAHREAFLRVGRCRSGRALPGLVKLSRDVLWLRRKERSTVVALPSSLRPVGELDR